ncbi:chemotaxis protein CheB [Clostridium fungisolvens]|uniref:protein-glutamate methylesterase n=1 Tax=Clostridium fungisolvens TaxID=1604897 RepID=A0A6V8SAS3_9CLOT|nr:chemotaxis protein CheB [Clostridium fungisolvens]GFP74180.1 Protein-glutamate methylesterase/protein-glutamine glutaminase [Clostridium fungisolvens]
MKFRCVVIGASAGGIEAIATILKVINRDFPVPIVIVQHLSPESDGYLIKYFDSICRLKVKEAEEKEKITSGYVYIAPPNYHLLIEKDETLSLTVEDKENYSRPSIDVLFETASDCFKHKLIGVILTGANGDGSKGLKTIKQYGGMAIIEDPNTAAVSLMPQIASKTLQADYIIPLGKIVEKLIELTITNGYNEY